MGGAYRGAADAHRGRDGGRELRRRGCGFRGEIQRGGRGHDVRGGEV